MNREEGRGVFLGLVTSLRACTSEKTSSYISANWSVSRFFPFSRSFCFSAFDVVYFSYLIEPQEHSPPFQATPHHSVKLERYSTLASHSPPFTPPPPPPPPPPPTHTHTHS